MEMPNGLTVARTAHRLLSGQTPVFYSLLVRSSFGGMPCEYFGLHFDNFWKFLFHGGDNSAMESLPVAAQQRAIGGILHQSVLEQIGRVRGHALPEKQTSRTETVERRLKFRVRFARHRC